MVVSSHVRLPLHRQWPRMAALEPMMLAAINLFIWSGCCYKTQILSTFMRVLWAPLYSIRVNIIQREFFQIKDLFV